MKKLLLIISVMLLCMNSYAQEQPAPAQSMTKQDYIQKSKNQKTTAWIMLGGGTAMAVGGMVWVVNNLFEPDQGESVVFFMGLGAMIGSIPCLLRQAVMPGKQRIYPSILNWRDLW